MGIPRSRALTVVAVAAVLASTAFSGAAARDLIRSWQIKDGTIRSADIRDSAIKSRDLHDGSVHLNDVSRTIARMLRKDAPPRTPDPFPENVPPGAILRGVWGFSSFSYGTQLADWMAVIDFRARMLGSLDPVFRPVGAVATEDCPGTADQPEAAPGFLCIYEQDRFGGVPSGQGAGPYGATIRYAKNDVGNVWASGTYAARNFTTAP
jgi:hypothetical protein